MITNDEFCKRVSEKSLHIFALIFTSYIFATFLIPFEQMNLGHFTWSSCSILEISRHLAFILVSNYSFNIFSCFLLSFRSECVTIGIFFHYHLLSLRLFHFFPPRLVIIFQSCFILIILDNTTNPPSSPFFFVYCTWCRFCRIFIQNE